MFVSALIAVSCTWDAPLRFAEMAKLKELPEVARARIHLRLLVLLFPENGGTPHVEPAGNPNCCYECHICNIWFAMDTLCSLVLVKMFHFTVVDFVISLHCRK